MSQTVQIFKPRLLYGKFLSRLTELQYRHEIIPYSSIYEKICRNFSITKSECKEILFLLNDLGIINLRRHGLILCFEVKDE